MRKRLRKSDEAADVNVTPLLDIVFIMLIFFIVTATFVNEQGIDVSSPADTPPDTDKIPPPSMILSVLPNGLVQVDSGREVDPFSIKATVQEFLARNPEGVLLVSSAPTAETGVTVVVMDQARQAGATGKLSLTLQGEAQS